MFFLGFSILFFVRSREDSERCTFQHKNDFRAGFKFLTRGDNLLLNSECCNLSGYFIGTYMLVHRSRDAVLTIYLIDLLSFVT